MINDIIMLPKSHHIGRRNPALSSRLYLWFLVVVVGTATIQFLLTSILRTVSYVPNYSFRYDIISVSSTILPLQSDTSNNSNINILPPPLVTTTRINSTNGTTSQQQQQQQQQSSSSAHTIDPADKNCIFRHSPLYRSVFVYPSPGEPEWTQWADFILSDSGRLFDSTFRYPWQIIEERTRINQDFHFRLRDARAMQYTTELLVREILIHPESCLRTDNPETAKLFFVPYMVSMEWHNGTQYPSSFDTSPYAQAIIDILDHHNYTKWEQTWGLTANYWKRRHHGADHILVMSEGCHGLRHPRSLAGNQVLIQAQKQLTPPIIIYKDTSQTFVRTYPKCTAKNIVVPVPNPDGRWYNGRIDTVAAQLAQNASMEMTTTKTTSTMSPPPPIRLLNDPSKRPLSYYYKAGNHGSCRLLRQQLEHEFEFCSATGKYIQQQIKRRKLPKGYHFPHAFRHATFCPCPGGDTPNSKRYFDAIMSGCIPLILSADFVWPYSKDIPGARPLVHESHISIRLHSSDYYSHDNSKNNNDNNNNNNNKDCNGTTVKTIQSFIESISSNEIQRLQGNLPKAAATYSYYEQSSNLPNHPLWERILPNGPAAHALVQALADRVYGQRWLPCQQEELSIKDPTKDNIYTFQC